jgi:hypothetical protein
MMYVPIQEVDKKQGLAELHEIAWTDSWYETRKLDSMWYFIELDKEMDNNLKLARR